MTHLFRIAQESITNAIRHGEAHHVAVELSRVRDQLKLTVRDDDVGLPYDFDEPPKGRGLRSMRSRAAAMDGSLEFHSHPSGGTTVTCLIPLNNNEEGESV